MDMKIVISSDDESIRKEIVRPEEFDFKEPSMRESLMNEIRDAFSLILVEESEKT
jgi:hypothetical protein